MALQPCRECGQTVSTEATTCPHCGAPVKPAVGGGSPGTERPERELYHDGHVTVTTRRLLVGATTYAMQGITSVVMSKTRLTPGGRPIGCGIILALAAAVPLGVQSTGGPPQWGEGLALIAVAAILVGGGLWQNRRQLVTFSVTLTTASGEQTAFSSTDEAVVREIVERLNQAIASRD